MADIVKHFNIAGNYIDKQYVETQNILVSAPQIVVTSAPSTRQHSQAAQPARSKTVSPKRSPHFLETPPLIYKYAADTFTPVRRLTLLYQFLCKEYEPTKTWMDPDTTPDAFLSLFGNQPTNAVIIWTAPKQRLFGLFKRMKERKIISTPKGYGLWQIIQNHFSDWHGNMFQDFNKEHIPAEPAYSAIEAFIDILDPTQTTDADLAEYTKRSSANRLI